MMKPNRCLFTLLCLSLLSGIFAGCMAPKADVFGTPVDAVRVLPPDIKDESTILAEFSNKSISAFVIAEDEKSRLLFSADAGKTWYAGQIRQSGSNGAASNAPFSSAIIGFTSERDGWLIGSVFVGLGRQENYVYLTSDAGKTWSETGNVNAEYARVLNCGGFADCKIGFLCFRVVSADDSFPVFRTGDGGATWTKLEMLHIEQPQATYWDMTNIEFGEIYKIHLTDHASGQTVSVLTSGDYGITWETE